MLIKGSECGVPFQVEQQNYNLQLQNRGGDWSLNQTQLSKGRLYLLQVDVGIVSEDPNLFHCRVINSQTFDFRALDYE